MLVKMNCSCRYSSVGIALGYGLGDWGSRVRFPAGAGNFSLHHRVQNNSGAHSASYPMGTRVSFPVVKRPERETDHSPPSSVEVKNAWSYTSTSQYVFMAWCLVKHKDNFTFYLLPNRSVEDIPTGVRVEYSRIRVVQIYPLMNLLSL
jgi:hypothetical protein